MPLWQVGPEGFEPPPSCLKGNCATVDTTTPKWISRCVSIVVLSSWSPLLNLIVVFRSAKSCSRAKFCFAKLRYFAERKTTISVPRRGIEPRPTVSKTVMHPIHLQGKLVVREVLEPSSTGLQPIALPSELPNQIRIFRFLGHRSLKPRHKKSPQSIK